MAREFTRTTISVPISLKERMDAIKKRVNWSQLACEAFERELIKLEEEQVQESRLERFRKTVAKASSDTYKGGRDSGAEWASDEASGEELEALYQFREKILSEFGNLGSWLALDKPKPLTNSSIIGLVLLGVPEEKWPESADKGDAYMGQAYGDRSLVGMLNFKTMKLVEATKIERDAYDKDKLRGWIDGACELWEEYRDKL